MTLIGEARRLVMKEVVRAMDAEQRGDIKTRAVLPPVVEHFRTKLGALRGDLGALLKEEAELKELRVAEMHLNRASNVMAHDEEIAARPARTWFTSQAGKERAAAAAKKEAESGGAWGSGQEKKKLPTHPPLKSKALVVQRCRTSEWKWSKKA